MTEYNITVFPVISFFCMRVAVLKAAAPGATACV